MWEAILFILAGGGVVCAIALRDYKRRQAWQEAVASRSLLEVETWSPSRLTARAGPLAVQLEVVGDKYQLTQIQVTVPGPPDFCNMSLRPESLFQRGGEIEIGDPPFDTAFFIEGPVQMVFALLEAETRSPLLRLSYLGKLEVSNGVLRAEVLHSYVPQALPLLIEAGRRFAQPLDIPRRLAENANRDPKAEVRLQNLLVLVRELPGEPATVEALRKACSDPSPEIRLRAAKELGPEGRDTLLQLAEGNVDDTVGAKAMSIMGRELPVERKKAILDRALAARRIQTARVCLEVLGRSEAAAIIETLAKVAEYEQVELAVAAVRALEGIGSPAEPSLIVALQREEKEVRMAAAYALGRVGSVAAVLPLKDAAEQASRGMEILHAARLAIAEIQSRLQGASPGQLSLAGGEAGQLSLTEAEAGQLSLADDPAGQLSLGGDGVD